MKSGLVQCMLKLYKVLTADGRIVTAKGILWDKYVNKRRILRKISILNLNKKSTNASGESSSKVLNILTLWSNNIMQFFRPSYSK